MTSLFTQIKTAYQDKPDKIALIIGNSKISFHELNENVQAVSYHLHKLGVCSGNKVVVVLPNGLDFVITMLALAELNAVIVPLALGTNANAFKVACENTSTQHVIAWHASISSYKTQSDKHNINIKNWISSGKTLPFAHLFEDLYQPHPEMLEWSGSGTESNQSQIDQSLPYILTMTSGSTGAPKPITLSQATKVKRALSAIDLYDVTNQDITIIATPLYHSLAERLVFVSLLSGGTIVLIPKFTITNWLQQIAEHKVTFTIAVSSQLKQILQVEQLPDLSSLRCVVSSSALLDIDIKQQLLQKLNCGFHECYGASEIAIATNIKFDRNNPIDSVGTAIPNTELLILDDNRKPVNTGVIGEIACKTPMVFSGYYQQEENSKQAFQQDYFCTGDLGKLDSLGNLYFVGRKKEIIITGGINVYPSDIESVIKENDYIDTAVAFALSDAKLGEVVAIALTMTLDLTMTLESTNSSAVKQADIENAIQHSRIACATKLDAQQQPHKYFVFAQLPQNAMGKINKIEIKHLAEKITNAQLNQKSQCIYQMEHRIGE
jgi:acyl-CoA synthetase (AMP-forming)/AMP-acid ligase II